MISRYAIERELLKVEEIKPLDVDNFVQSLGPGYAKPKYLQPNIGGRIPGCIPSKDITIKIGLKKDITIKIGLKNMTKWKKEVLDGINKNQTLGRGALGSLFEGHYHGLGHIIIARNCHTSNSTSNGAGVMAYHHASARDPIFYRWHKHIDDIVQIYYDRQAP